MDIKSINEICVHADYCSPEAKAISVNMPSSVLTGSGENWNVHED